MCDTIIFQFVCTRRKINFVDIPQNTRKHTLWRQAEIYFDNKKNTSQYIPAISDLDQLEEIIETNNKVFEGNEWQDTTFFCHKIPKNIAELLTLFEEADYDYFDFKDKESIITIKFILYADILKKLQHKVHCDVQYHEYDLDVQSQQSIKSLEFIEKGWTSCRRIKINRNK